MQTERLGPNGALLRAMDKLGRVRIPNFNADFTLIDTPGQLEAFAFHKSGPKIARRFSKVTGVFLIDATIGLKDMPAAYLYSLAVKYRLGIDMVTVLNKVDLLTEVYAEKIKRFLANPSSHKLSLKKIGVLADIYVPLSEMLERVVPAQRIPLVSAKTEAGFMELLSLLYEVKCVCGDLT